MYTRKTKEEEELVSKELKLEWHQAGLRAGLCMTRLSVMHAERPHHSCSPSVAILFFSWYLPPPGSLPGFPPTSIQSSPHSLQGVGGGVQSCTPCAVETNRNPCFSLQVNFTGTLCICRDKCMPLHACAHTHTHSVPSPAVSSFRCHHSAVLAGMV